MELQPVNNNLKGILTSPLMVNLAIVIFCILMYKVMVYHNYSEKDLKQSLINHGYSDVKLNKETIFRCSYYDVYAMTFSAYNIKGKKIRGKVCLSRMGESTVKLNF